MTLVDETRERSSPVRPRFAFARGDELVVWLPWPVELEGAGLVVIRGALAHEWWLYLGHMVRTGLAADGVATLEIVFLPVGRVDFTGRLLVVEPPAALVPFADTAR